MNHKHDVLVCGAKEGKKQGFTLTELIAVVAVLLLLGCVWLPALGSSGDSAKRAVCVNNLRQLGMALTMYANEFRDYLPPPNWDGGSVAGAPGWLYTVTNGTIPDPGPGGAYANNPQVAYATGLWFQYVRDPRAYLCPVDIESQSFTITNATGRRKNRLSSYIMNGSVCGFTSFPYRSCKVTDAWSPSCYLLWGPDENGASVGNPGLFAFNDGSVYPSLNEGMIERLHTVSGGQMLTVGGSVVFVSVQKFRTEATAAGKNYAYWGPF